MNLVVLPMVLSDGILLSILGTFFVKTKEGGNPQTALNTGSFGAPIAMAIASFCDQISLRYFYYWRSYLSVC